eukprot:1161917-Pelagomonas_calceolata.AAC.12
MSPLCHQATEQNANGDLEGNRKHPTPEPYFLLEFLLPIFVLCNYYRATTSKISRHYTPDRLQCTLGSGDCRAKVYKTASVKTRLRASEKGPLISRLPRAPLAVDACACACACAVLMPVAQMKDSFSEAGLVTQICMLSSQLAFHYFRACGPSSINLKGSSLSVGFFGGGAGRLVVEIRGRRARASRSMADDPPDPYWLCFLLSPRLATHKCAQVQPVPTSIVSLPILLVPGPHKSA